MVKIFINPKFTSVDKGYHGGIRRVIDAQREYFGDRITDDYNEADVIAIHAGSLVPVRPDQGMVAHCHGMMWNKYNWDPSYNELNKLVIEAMRQADIITAPTEWVANSIRHGMYSECTVIGHGVDVQWTPVGSRERYVLWNKSRIDQVCNPVPVYKLAQMMPDVEFKMTVGQALTKNITITGLTPYADVLPVQQAGVYLATAQETFGIGILEALACGVPVVGWNWGGQAEIIEHGVTGWLAREGDYASLAEGIRWALSTDITDSCIAAAKNYTWEKACRSYEEVYERATKKKSKKVSVIIRNYNLEEYLEDAINSCVGQLDSQQDELIVLDDCSTDNSKEVFDSVKSSIFDGPHNIKWVQTPTNLHLAGAQSYGIEHSEGEYIVLLDADNMLAPNMIDTLKEALDNDRKIDIAYGRIRFVKPDGVTPDARISGHEDGISAWPPATFRLERQLAHNNQIPCTAMYRRRVYDRVGPYRARCRVAEDADFWCRATSLGFRPAFITDAPTFIYRNRPGTLSQTSADWNWEKWYDWRGRPPLAAYGNHTPSVASCEPLVTVIIPVGVGHELALQDALDSVYYQTLKNWNCIVVNDTGKPLPWIPPWAKVLNTKKIGVSAARNIALESIKTPTWLPLDADDYLAPEALERFLSTYVKNGGYAYSDYYTINTDDVKLVRVPDDCCSRISQEMPHLVTCLYPTNNLRFDETLEIAEDWDFALQMTYIGYCGVRVPEPLVYYRHSTGNRRVRFTDDHRIALRDKWEGLQVAGCGCGGNKGRIVSQPVNILDQAQNDLSATGIIDQVNSNQMTLLQYIGEEQKRYFTGKVTKQIYAFGTMANHNVKWVYNDDVPGFLDRQEFRLAADSVLSGGMAFS